MEALTKRELIDALEALPVDDNTKVIASSQKDIIKVLWLHESETVDGMPYVVLKTGE